MYRTLIIEDHPAAEADLRDRLSLHPEVVVTGSADSVERARTLLAKGDYNLVFLDIQLRGGDAFDLFPFVDPRARVIFVTAYNQYAVRAFEVNALDFLLKPVEPQRLALSLSRLHAPTDQTADEPPFGSPLRPDDVVHLREETGSQLVPLAKICAIKAAQNYTELFLSDGRKSLTRRPLKDWENSLKSTDFIRISRDTLINLSNVVHHERTGQRGGTIWLRGLTDPVQASFRLWPTVKARLP